MKTRNNNNKKEQENWAGSGWNTRVRKVPTTIPSHYQQIQVSQWHEIYCLKKHSTEKQDFNVFTFLLVPLGGIVIVDEHNIIYLVYYKHSKTLKQTT